MGITVESISKLINLEQPIVDSENRRRFLTHSADHNKYDCCGHGIKLDTACPECQILHDEVRPRFGKGAA